MNGLPGAFSAAPAAGITTAATDAAAGTGGANVAGGAGGGAAAGDTGVAAGSVVAAAAGSSGAHSGATEGVSCPTCGHGATALVEGGDRGVISSEVKRGGEATGVEAMQDGVFLGPVGDLNQSLDVDDGGDAGEGEDVDVDEGGLEEDDVEEEAPGLSPELVAAGWKMGYDPEHGTPLLTPPSFLYFFHSSFLGLELEKGRVYSFILHTGLALLIRIHYCPCTVIVAGRKMCLTLNKKIYPYIFARTGHPPLIQTTE